MGIVIIDTNVLIDIYRNKREALNSLKNFKVSELTITPTIYAEFLGGAKLEYKSEAKKFLQQFKVLHKQENTTLFNLCTKHEFKKQRSDKRNSSLADFMIAADAIKQKAIFVTQNKVDFEHFVGIEIYDYNN